MKGCILETNFEGRGWSSTLFTILLILTCELRYLQNKGVNKKRGREGVLEVILPRRAQTTFLGEGMIYLGDQG